VQSSRIFAVAVGVLLASLVSAPVFAASETIHIQTMVLVSKENPAQKRAVAKFGEVYAFVPSTIVVTQGDHVTLDIRNLEAGGDDGHTLTMPGYGINVSLPPLSTKTVTFTASKVGVFPFYCEFHKPWMSGKLVVLPAHTQ